MAVNQDIAAFMVGFERVEKQDLTMLVLDRIRTLLEKGILRPGSKFPTEQEMTKLLGISRPSLRQAYKVLNVLGIIRAVPGDGTYINDSTTKILAMPLMFLMLMKKITLEDIFAFRITVEGELAALAAARATPEDVLEIGTRLEAMAALIEDIKQYQQAEYEFHNAIARAAHNPLLLEIIVIVSELLLEMRKELLPFASDIKGDLEQHRHIYEKICERDAEGARAALHHHLRMALQLAKKSGLIKEHCLNAG